MGSPNIRYTTIYFLFKNLNKTGFPEQLLKSRSNTKHSVFNAESYGLITGEQKIRTVPHFHFKNQIYTYYQESNSTMMWISRF